VNRRGFYPNGGGRVQFAVTPQFNQKRWSDQRSLAPPLIVKERGELRQVQIYSIASVHLRERKVATRQASACYNQLAIQPKQTHIDHAAAYSPGSALTVVAEYTQTRLGVDVLGERGKSSEQVGEEAAEKLMREIETTAIVDVHTADNLMVWTALFGGRYTFAEVTGHIATNAWVIEQFLPGALRLEGMSVRGGER
jgi:RNA 3'-terminal phosphate cyclase (ATP)